MRCLVNYCMREDRSRWRRRSRRHYSSSWSETQVLGMGLRSRAGDPHHHHRECFLLLSSSWWSSTSPWRWSLGLPSLSSLRMQLKFQITKDVSSWTMMASRREGRRGCSSLNDHPAAWRSEILWREHHVIERNWSSSSECCLLQAIIVVRFMMREKERERCRC